MIRARTAVAVSALLLALAGCGDTDTNSTPAGTSESAGPAESKPAAEAPADPYEVYQKLAPDGAPDLSREDAQTRALLGCDQKWAPGTVDAALAEAYADLCNKGG
ncbi:hypothetical protein [Micromonospora sp. NPDC005367]|uniref:hypothetical protein n=1 Tax=Micromonospora sp. NPDC005367 TaxID=3155590 RepID=UPI0033AC35A9